MTDDRYQLDAITNDLEIGWWFRAVLDQFAFLEDDYHMRVVDVHRHFQGHYVKYHSGRIGFAIEFEPDGPALLADFLKSREDTDRAWGAANVAEVLAIRAPGEDWSFSLDAKSDLRQVVLNTMQRWADGIRNYASDVLEGHAEADLRWSQQPR